MYRIDDARHPLSGVQKSKGEPSCPTDLKVLVFSCDRLQRKQGGLGCTADKSEELRSSRSGVGPRFMIQDVHEGRNQSLVIGGILVEIKQCSRPHTEVGIA